MLTSFLIFKKVAEQNDLNGVASPFPTTESSGLTSPGHCRGSKMSPLPRNDAPVVISIN